MSDRPTFISRLGDWLRRRPSDELPLERHARETMTEEAPGAAGPAGSMLDRVEVRPLSFFRPFAKRDAAIQSLRSGVHSLSDLMGAIRENLETQGRRQDQMLSYLSHLPELLHHLPEAHKIQAETLKSIGQQLHSQVEQQRRLAEILEKVSDSGTQQREYLHELHGQVETLTGQNESISDNLRQVGETMEGMGKSSESSAAVLRQLKDNLASRDTQFEQILRRQNTRLTVLLTIAIILSVASIMAVAVMGYLMVKRT